MHSSADQRQRQEKMLSLRGFAAFIHCVVLLTASSGDGSEVINGKEAQPHSLPFMALLESKAPSCGGTLIHPQWVLTAAHCRSIKTVLLGVHSISSKTSEKYSRQVRNVIRSVRHPHYDEKTHDNDLKLLKLDSPVRQTKWVKPRGLNDYVRDPKAGTKCLVAGWGRTNYKIKKMSDVLMFAYVTAIDRTTCNSRDYYNFNPFITKNMMCAGSDGGNVADTCSGDSGGPILCNGELVGVTSFGHECGIIKKPGVYTFLTKDLLDWVRNIMKT